MIIETGSGTVISFLDESLEPTIKFLDKQAGKSKTPYELRASIQEIKNMIRALDATGSIKKVQ